MRGFTLLNSIQNYIFSKKFKFLFIISYVLTISVLLATSHIVSLNNAMSWIKNDMQTKLKDFTASIETEFREKTEYALGISDSNLLKMPLNLGVYGQLRYYFENDQKIKNQNIKLLVLNVNNEIIFNNTGSINNLSGFSLLEEAYTGYILNDDIYLVNYIPIFYENEALGEKKHKIGAIITVNSISELANSKPKSLEYIGYIYIGFENEILRLVYDKSPYIVERPMNSTIRKKLAERFATLNIDGKEIFVCNSHIKTLNNDQDFVLSIAISPSDRKKIETSYILTGIKNSVFVIISITLTLLIAYKIAKKYFINKLEIQTLRAQRHDYAKHLNILQGLAAMGEHEEFKKYANALVEKTTFMGELLKLECPPLYILFEEMERKAGEAGVVLKIETYTSLEKLEIDKSDLCVILGNLVENAIEACAEAKTGSREVHIEIGKNDGSYYFDVSNTPNTIHEKELSRLFLPGYTTKTGNGRGMGLYIVSRTIRKYHGSIEIKTGDDTLILRVFLPERKKQHSIKTARYF